MRAACYSAYRGAIDVIDMAEPEVPVDGVVVRVDATGVCRSDWHAWQGHDDDVTLPHVPGHEFAGTVVASGDAVGSVVPGERIVVPFVLGCGSCDVCIRGDAQLCPTQLQPGFHLPGSFAEYVAVPRADFNVVAVPEAISTLAAASLGCRYTTAWRGLVQRGGIGKGTHVAVFGCGGVGLAAIQIALAFNARVTAIDPAAAARRRAEAMGVAAFPNAAGLPAEVDLALDAIGHPEVATAALAMLRPGGRLVQIGILDGSGTAAVPLNRLMRYELEIVGSHGMAAGGFSELLELVAAGRLDPETLVTDRVDLNAGIDHLRHMPERPGRVVMIEQPAA